MYLKLKNVERSFRVDAPTERTAKGAEKSFWVISFKVNEQLSTEEIEQYFSQENVETMTFVTPLPNGTEYEYEVNGYVSRVFNLIRHSQNGECAVELQFSKEASDT